MKVIADNTVDRAAMLRKAIQIVCAVAYTHLDQSAQLQIDFWCAY